MTLTFVLTGLAGLGIGMIFRFPALIAVSALLAAAVGWRLHDGSLSVATGAALLGTLQAGYLVGLAGMTLLRR